MKTHLEEVVLIYHPESDQLCLACARPDGGMVLRSIHAEALFAFVGWGSRDARYEPKLYRWVIRGWRWFLVKLLRRPVQQGDYQRTIAGQDGEIRITVTHYGKKPAALPFFRRFA